MKDAMKDRRSSSRQKAFLQGRIYFNNRRTSIDCLVRDISEHGARLKFAHAPVTPEVVDLYIPNKDESRRAKVQWRAAEEMGVTFGTEDDAPPLVPASAPADWAARVSQLERQLAVVQRKVNELQTVIRQIQGAD